MWLGFSACRGDDSSSSVYEGPKPVPISHLLAAAADLVLSFAPKSYEVIVSVARKVGMARPRFQGFEGRGGSFQVPLLSVRGQGRGMKGGVKPWVRRNGTDNVDHQTESVWIHLLPAGPASRSTRARYIPSVHSF